MRFLTLGLLTLLLVGCLTRLSGTVSSASYVEPPQQPLFTVVTPNALSLTDRNIAGLIEKKMTERGYKKAVSSEIANVAVVYSYSIGAGQTDVSSGPDFVWGGQKVESTTVYPRFFQLIIVDLKKSNIPEKKIEIIWQGEIHSSGSSSNISLLAENFIDVLFENYGSTVTNKSFFKVVTW